MSRAVRRILICALLGAVTTVAVAWGCALWAPITGPQISQRFDGDPLAGSYRSFLGSDSFTGLEYTDGFGVRSTRISSFSPPRPFSYGASLRRVVDVWEAGWPALGMSCVGMDELARVQGGPRPPMQRQSVEWRGGLHTPHYLNPRQSGFAMLLPYVRPIPYAPVWPGFALNTAFYGAAWYGVLFAPGVVRRSLRRRRGACVGCGYDLRATETGVCPECGAGESSE